MPKRKKTQRKSIQRMPSKIGWRERFIMCLGEVVGTAMLVLFGCMSDIHGLQKLRSVSSMTSSFGFGLTVMNCIIIFAHISGAHFNPAVTVAAVILKRVPLIMIPLYTISQCFGAIVGYGILKMLVPMHLFQNRVCVTAVHPDISVWQGLGIEFFLTSVLILVCCGVWDERNRKDTDAVSIKFGLTITLLALAGGPLTGCSMNPARSFAPALFNNSWNDHWIYWIGPLLGGIIPTFIYRIVFSKSGGDDSSNEANIINIEDLPLQKPGTHNDQITIT